MGAKKNMKLRKTALIVGALAMAAMVQTAQANLASLISTDGSLTTGDGQFTFSDFSLSGNGGVIAQADNFNVSTINIGGIDYLSFSGSTIGLINSAGSVDLSLFYTVTANNGSKISMIDQRYTPDVNNFAGAGDQIIVGETVSDLGGVTTANSTLTLQPLDLSDPTAETGDNLVLGTAISPGHPPVPQIVALVEKDFTFTSGSSSDTVGLSILRQSFHAVPVPEASTMIAGALLLLPLGVSTLRILRRNRIA